MDKIELVKINIEYCEICTLPFEFCEYSKKKCSGEITEPENEENPEEDKKVEENTEKKPKKSKPMIKIELYEKKNRGLSKISGFEKLGIEIKPLVKKLTKKLGCGAGSKTKDSFEMQGLYRDIMIELLCKELKELELTEDNFEVVMSLKSKKKPRIIN